MQRGFTLLEMLVAVGLFSVVTLIAVGSLLIISSAQKKAFFVQTNQDNVRFALESMAREIRTGIRYYQHGGAFNQETRVLYNGNPANCDNIPTPVSTDSCLKFVNSAGEVVIIKKSTDLHECGDPSGVTSVSCITKSTTAIPRGGPGTLPVDINPFQPLTAPEVRINEFHLLLSGERTDASDFWQPKVTIIIRAVTPGLDPRQSRLDVQTTVSQLDPEQQT